MRPIIRVEDLSKQYQIGARTPGYGTLRETLAGAMTSPFRRAGRKPRPARETLWVLDGVSFEVSPGEVVGVIGRNGAGKSTLLKVLARITEPTRGRVELYGRVGSLLEVGTGFHPELSGRDNVFLNGAILGMRRAEIERKFDEIVAFAEVERFLDTPVKRYSSGMYVRLAFAVAAHLDPEILLVDEVLAVGDAAFQKKCLTKMGGVAREGRTVLFVSHNFEAVKSLCTRCLLVDHGRLIEDAAPTVAVERALAQLRGNSPSAFKLQSIREAPGIPLPTSIEVEVGDRPAGEMITFGDDILVTLRLDEPLLEGHTFALQVATSGGVAVFNSFYRDHPDNPPLRPGETRSVTARIPAGLLPGGVYEVAFAYMLPNAEIFWLAQNAWFEVHDVKSYRNEGLSAKRTGLISIILPWDAD